MRAALSVVIAPRVSAIIMMRDFANDVARRRRPQDTIRGGAAAGVAVKVPYESQFVDFEKRRSYSAPERSPSLIEVPEAVECQPI